MELINGSYTKDDILKQMSDEELKNRSSDDNSNLFSEAMDRIKGMSEDFATYDSICTSLAQYGAGEYEVGFIAGFKKATRILMAAMQA